MQTPDLRTAAERVRDTLMQGNRPGYEPATDDLWTAYRHGQTAPVTLQGEAQQ